MNITRRTAIAGSAAALTLAGPAVAQNFPRKAIQLIVAFPPGGSTDVGARIVASMAEKEFGQPVVVVNKGGAGGQLGFTELARARPDGYTVGFINLPAVNTIVLDPERKAIFDVDGFVPVINQVLDPGIIWVKADSPYKTLADLVEAAKKAPGKVSACTTGILSDDHLAMLMVHEAAKIEFRIVHFDGGAQQLTAILGGHVEAAFDNVGSILKRVQSGEVRVLAVMDNERSKFLPDVPTTKELGYPTVVSSSTRGVATPKGTPPDIVKALEAGFRKAMANPEHVKKMEDAGLALRIMSGDEYAKYYRDVHAQAKKYTEWALKMR
ncbi:MAG TPA: tripartite tricarboxylate transporter substrate binding protein [Vineibacter sp.]|nr:tripartite tricarboxylate transporter substrate binding protein [Vineibacter sp.]